MIGYLKGNVVATNDDQVILDVNGVGYRVFVGEYIGDSEEDVQLFIYTSVSERAIDLYGFRDTDDLEVFELLLNVSGIGPKKAMGILSKISAKDLIKYVSMEQAEKLKTSGVGKKTSEKIVIELKSKVEKLDVDTSGGGVLNEIDKVMYLDVIEALSALGYKKGEIDNALKQVDIDSYDKTEDLVKQLLNLLR